MSKNAIAEKWIPIKNYEGLYEISNLGVVRNAKTLNIVAPFKNHGGYLRVNLWANNSARKYSIHRLVAEAFIPNPEGKPQVNHIDENKTNNRVDNLEWCTNVENHNHGTINARISKALINNEKKSKKTAAYNDNGDLIFEFPSVYEASRQTGINVSSIRDSLHGRVKHAGGYIWRFQSSS